MAVGGFSNFPCKFATCPCNKVAQTLAALMRYGVRDLRISNLDWDATPSAVEDLIS